MKTKTKVLMIISLSLLVAGLIVACIGVTLMDFNFLMLNTTKTVTKTHTVTEDFHSISISENTSDVVFLPSEDETVRIVCNEQKKVKHSVSVQNGVLTVKLVDTRKWYDYITIFNFGKYKTTVYLPKDTYKNVTVKTNTGDINMPDGYIFENASLSVDTGDVSWSADVSGALRIESDTGDVKIANAAVGSLKLESDTGDVKIEKINATGIFNVETDTGDIRMTNVNCGDLKLEADTGNIALTDTLATAQINIETDTGDVKFTRSDAATISVKTDTGNVTGSFLTDKIIHAKSSTGNVSVPELTTGGKCTVRSSTGNIRLEIENAK